MIVESYEDVIVLSGALRSNFWDTVHTAISLLLRRHPSGVIIDCHQITECTIEGADTFRDVLHFINSNDARVICAAVPPAVMDVLKAVPEVRSQLPIAQTVEEARHSLDLLHEEPERGKKKPMPKAESDVRIVLNLVGDDRDLEGIPAGCRMASYSKAELFLAYIIVVPRDLPLQAPLHDEEDKAREALERAKKIVEEWNLPYRVVLERGRDLATTFDAIMEEHDASNLIIPLGTAERDLEGDLKMIRSVLSKVHRFVAFIRPEAETKLA